MKKNRNQNPLFEFLDADNRFLFKDPQYDSIVSPSVISYMLSQIASNSELAAVYSALSRAWGPEIVLQPASEYLENIQTSFEELVNDLENPDDTTSTQD